jgi:DNA-binding NtrC family response regulator
VDVRIIATTRRNLADCVADGAFRDDLYRRLNALAIHLPPLRERAEDIPPLVWRFVDEFSRSYGRPIDTIAKETMAALQRYDWPGNARELRNVVECAVMSARSRRLHIPLPGDNRPQTLAEIQRAHIKSALAACGGEIRGEHGAAARLGVTPRVLEAKIAKLGL